MTKKTKEESEEIDSLSNNKINKRINKWSEQEVIQLFKCVDRYGDNWQTIAEKFPKKSSKQCMQKYRNSQRKSKKGNWSEEEDELLLNWVSENGAQKWTECSKFIRGRCGKQCRERWVNILNPQVKKGNWDDNEQEKIFELLKKYNTSWSNISKVLKGRTENSIKNYFYSSMRRFKSNPIMHIIKNLYVTKTVSFSGVQKNNSFLQTELQKLNTLSQKIALFLLNPDQENEYFQSFILNILFGNDYQEQIDVQNQNLIPKVTDKKMSFLDENSENEFFLEQQQNNESAILAVMERLCDLNKRPLFSNLFKNLNQRINIEKDFRRSDKDIEFMSKHCHRCSF